MINTIILGHALNILPKLPAESVNCVVTSPPFWGLRDYGIEPVTWDGDKDCRHKWGNKSITLKHKPGETNPGKESWFKDSGASDDKGNCFCLKCGAWRGSLGLEPTFELYIKHLCDIFDEVKRVLKKDGTCWVNLGDSYNGSKVGNTNASTGAIGKPKYSGNFTKTFKKENQSNIPTKSLCLIPQRFVIEMVNRGWILRNTIIWHKPNCMPSSAKDRFTVDFEYVYFFVKSKKYWFEQQFDKAEYLEVWSRKGSGPNTPYEQNNPRKRWGLTKHEIATKRKGSYVDPLHKKPIYPQGKNKRAVWTIPTQPFPEAHFAVYPETLIEPMIKAGCPRYVCKKCGKARVKVLDKTFIPRPTNDKPENYRAIQEEKKGNRKLAIVARKGVGHNEYKFKGYTDCGCNAGWESGVVLDPFMGAGTTALVALKQRKRFIGIEIKQEYIDMSYKRIARVQQRIF
ncbi:site-specific DNA-methyltransferase [Candidatus Atribacteria bacterium 1244-E10-H5-B2]|nr:MAG: site-specific DNA-methyltransferase [Candidatus Atribacteria bacterium 1244-E10-H5-B2]